MAVAPPEPSYIEAQVCRALDEDVGGGDLTAGLIPQDARARARVICREPAVLCGQSWFDQVFAALDGAVAVHWQSRDGDAIDPGATVCTLEGPARAVLTGERTALNFLQTLSATATRAHRYASTVAAFPVRILDTRKTIPGLRREQKYAVACGGCHNHRIGLFDAILIKENHIAAAGSITAVVAQARRLNPGLPVEIEVESLDELEQALGAGAEQVLLDNFPLEELRAAVQRANGRTVLEASGGVALDTIAAIAETGVDCISVGDLTKDIEAIDLSMRFE